MPNVSGSKGSQQPVPPPSVESQSTGLDQSSALTSGRIKVLRDVEPKLAGKMLRQQLDVRGLKTLKMALIHPKAMFDLATGRLAKMRQDNPAKYLEELNDLVTTSVHGNFVCDEGHDLISTFPRQTDLIKGQQRLALIKMTSLAAREPAPERFVEQMATIARHSDGVKIPQAMVRKGDIAKTFHDAISRAGRMADYVSEAEQANLLQSLQTIQKSVDGGKAPSYIKDAIHGLEPLNSTESARASKPSASQAQSPQAITPNEALATIAEAEAGAEELAELSDLLQATTTEDELKDLWQTFDSWQGLLTSAQELSFLREQRSFEHLQEEATPRLLAALVEEEQRLARTGENQQQLEDVTREYNELRGLQ